MQIEPRRTETPAGQPASNKVSRPARLMQSAALKLKKHGTLFVLTKAEYLAAREVVNAAVDFVNEHHALHPRTKKLPRVFRWRGARYWLEYTTLGRVHVRVTGIKARFPSAPIAI